LRESWKRKNLNKGFKRERGRDRVTSASFVHKRGSKFLHVGEKKAKTWTQGNHEKGMERFPVRRETGGKENKKEGGGEEES